VGRKKDCEIRVMDRGPTTELKTADVRRRRQFRARFPLAYAASYLLDGVVLALFAATGTIASWVPVAYTLAGCASAAVFYALLISGKCERSSDEFLMLPQVCVALAIMGVFLCAAPRVGFFFLGTIFIVMGFGSLQIRWRATAALWVITILTTGLILSTGSGVSVLPYSSPAERCLDWIWFGLTLGRTVLLGLIGSDWRESAHRRKEELKKVLARLHAKAIELQIVDARNAAMLSAMPDTLLRIDAQGVVLEVRVPKEARGGHYWPVQGQAFTQGYPPDAAQRLAAAVQRARQSGADQHVEYSLCQGEEPPSFFEARITMINEGEVLGLLRDITERKQAEARVARLAYFDSLTGLPNRAAFMDRLAREVRRAKRKAGRFGLLFLDLDGFKQINDTMGHNCGDQALLWTADRLRDALRPIDTVSLSPTLPTELSIARLGGDEFTLLITDVSGPEDVLSVAQRIGTVMRQPFAINGREFTLTSSIGVAVYPEDGPDAQTLLKHADTAMYHAKRLGRDNSQMYRAALTEQAVNRLELDTSLRGALGRGEFRLLYQPLIDVASGRMRAVEALIRWEHPLRGLIAPLTFIPLAEENGLISAIGQWVLQRACADLASWRHAGLPLHVAVNLSPKQLNRADLVPTVLQILAENALSPEHLELEITEGAVMENFATTVAALSAFRKHKIRIALDDFGTGYSSLSYLLQMPIDIIKVDRSFIARLSEDELGASIMQAILALAQTLGAGVTAEGVETLQQATTLQAMRCQTMQGYFFSPPVAADQIPELARRQWSTAAARTDAQPEDLLPSPAVHALR